MEKQNQNQNGLKKVDEALEGFCPVSSPRIYWKSRKRSASGRNLDKVMEDATNMKVMEDATNMKVMEDVAKMTPNKQEEPPTEEPPVLSERRKALFEPLEPTMNINGRRPLAESLLPPPDFDSTSYPKGWLIGKKRKLVNVDVVESMRRIAVQEMNRKDREIGGLNEQLDEDARCLEHLQVQLLQERSKRADVERENAMLQDQISMLMNMIQDNDSVGEDGPDDP